MAEKVSNDGGLDGKKAVQEVDYVPPELAEILRKKKEEDEQKKKGNKPKKPLGMRKDPWGDKGMIYVYAFLFGTMCVSCRPFVSSFFSVIRKSARQRQNLA